MLYSALMNPSRILSCLHLNGPMQYHFRACREKSNQHPVSIEIIDYCSKLNRDKTQTDMNPHNLVPIWSLIPNSMDRLAFDEVLCDPELFESLHNPERDQEISLRPPEEALDAIACDITAGAHHSACKYVFLTGSPGSGHGALAFGTSSGEGIPRTGLLWSILDALTTSDEWPKIACFTSEGARLRDLLCQSDAGNLFRPKTSGGLITAETLESDGMTFLTANRLAKVRLSKALHQKRRCLATWHALHNVIDRSENVEGLKLKAIYNQVGEMNYQVALDVCQATHVLICLGPEHDNSQILISDLPCYANNSVIAEYKATKTLSDVQRQAADIKNTLKKHVKDSLIGKLVIGCVPTLFNKNSLQRDLYLFSSVQVSDLERTATHAVLKLAAQADPFIADMYFNVFQREQARKQQIKHQINLLGSGLGSSATGVVHEQKSVLFVQDGSQLGGGGGGASLHLTAAGDAASDAESDSQGEAKQHNWSIYEAPGQIRGKFDQSVPLDQLLRQEAPETSRNGEAASYAAVEPQDTAHSYASYSKAGENLSVSDYPRQGVSRQYMIQLMEKMSDFINSIEIH